MTFRIQQADTVYVSSREWDTLALPQYIPYGQRSGFLIVPLYLLIAAAAALFASSLGCSGSYLVVSRARLRGPLR